MAKKVITCYLYTLYIPSHNIDTYLLDLKLKMTPSQERVLSTVKCIQLLRTVICLAAVLNIVVLTRSLQYPIHEEDRTEHGKYPGSSFG